jgi:hypothetical protein
MDRIDLRRRGAVVTGPAPAVSKTTPFSPRSHALAIYFKGFS